MLISNLPLVQDVSLSKKFYMTHKNKYIRVKVRRTLNVHNIKECIHENTESRKRKVSQERDVCGRFLPPKRARPKPHTCKEGAGVGGEEDEGRRVEARPHYKKTKIMKSETFILYMKTFHM